MDRYSYVLNRNGIEKETHGCYTKEELSCMTTYRLREICRRERLVSAAVDPMDQEELVRHILRFRGRAEAFFISEENERGAKRLSGLLEGCRITYRAETIKGCAKLVAYRGLAIDRFDGFCIGYHRELEDTNALLVSGNELCAILNLRSLPGRPGKLFLTKPKGLSCRESSVKNYQLYCFCEADSRKLYRLYQGEETIAPQNLSVYRVPILSFEVREPIEANMPLAIDFGTSNTTAGMYLDSWYFERLSGSPAAERLTESGINYVWFPDPANGCEETPMVPSVVGVSAVRGDGDIDYVYGYQAERLAKNSYQDESLCLFYDIKRWVSDFEKAEEVVDRTGKRSFVKRKDIIKGFLDYVIETAEQQFKCRVKALHITCPVKQKQMFLLLFREIFADYEIDYENMLDEGVAVLYHSISELIESRRYRNNAQYHALIIDCGGGTTDLSSCTFRIDNQRVSYHIDISTSYENGDTDFGGNNLTYRMMQMLKVELAGRIAGSGFSGIKQLAGQWNTDVFRLVDDAGLTAVYQALDDEYEKAEQVIPTRFKEYEHSSQNDYFLVKNNFYYLFETAEAIKKAFYNHTGLLGVTLSSSPAEKSAAANIPMEKWRVAVKTDKGIHVEKEFPELSFSIYDVNLLLKAEIYGIIKKFIEPMYDADSLSQYSMIRMTGQSCKIELFRGALKEFIPGRVIQLKKQGGDLTHDYELKLICLNGAVQYLKDRKYGFADVSVKNSRAALPYIVTAFSHTGEEKVLIHSLDRENTSGFISRNLENLTLKLYLKDAEGRRRYGYSCGCELKAFKAVEYKDIQEAYGSVIPQGDVDDIVDNEVRFFVWADPERWGFMVVPVLCRDGVRQLGPEQFYVFENEGWVKNFFDGTK